MEVLAYCSGQTSKTIRVGPREEGDLVVLLREALNHCRTEPTSGGTSLGQKFVIAGTFVHGPLGLMLDPADVESLASARASVEVRLDRDIEAHRRLLRASVATDQLEDHLPPPDGYLPEIEVVFGVRGPDLSFDDVTARLGLSPTSMTRPQRPFTNRGEARSQQWIFSSGPLRGRDFLEPLQSLLTLLTPRTEQIRAIADEMRVQPSVDLIALDYGERVPALQLQPEHLQLLANLRSRLWLDVL